MSSNNVQQSGLKRLFPLLANENVNMKKEIMAGITTFLTMAYIIAVNPNILSKTGMDAGALVTATCFSAALGCFLMGLIANLPFALYSCIKRWNQLANCSDCCILRRDYIYIFNAF